MKDIMNLSVVTFNATWGEKEKNLNRIKGYIESAARRGTDFIVFPEMALTGYDDEAEKPLEEKMQFKLSELIPGPSTDEIAKLTQKYGIYAVMGMPEKDKDDPTKLYNSVAVFSPEGLVGSYRKMHLPAPEPNWAVRGDKPFILDTPWGPIGLAICYDSYCFPELMRYYTAKGCRLYINSTALAVCHGKGLGTTTLEAGVIREGIYIASANLGGKDLYNEFWGGSSIIGPSRKLWEPYYYAGHTFTNEVASESELFTATIDLTLADRALFKYNPSVKGTDWRPDKYIEMFEDVKEKEDVFS
ncbi:MAG: carbon-nitrogen hydrolase family protein [Sporolactobacillus sp.]